MNNKLGFWGSNIFESMSDREAGLWAVKKFYEYNKEINPSDFSITLDDYIAYFDKQRGNQIEGLGLGIKFAELSENTVDDAMYKLAGYAEGRIQKDSSIFRQYLAEEVSDLSLFENPDAFFQFIVNASGQTVSDLADIAISTGNAVSNVGKGIEFWAKYSKFAIPATLAVGAYGAYKYFNMKKTIFNKFTRIKDAILK